MDDYEEEALRRAVEKVAKNHSHANLGAKSCRKKIADEVVEEFEKEVKLGFISLKEEQPDETGGYNKF